ncbi:MAG: SH3 domain-containing protein [Lentisphaeria bacterium]|nr:SH3 domain-containing protein [Lentisphaeria bacterium]
MDNAEYIWRWLWERLGNEYGTAGLMGNLCAESGLKPDNLQNSFERLLGMTDAEYTEAVDSGAYDEERFCTDSAGYGLAQWSYSSRKRGLYRAAKEHGTSVGDLDTQIAYIWQELAQREYRSVLNTLLNAKSVREASDAVMLGYEKPADQSVDNMASRAELGQMYYDRYAAEEPKSTARKLVIYKRLFYNSDCYKAGTKQTPTGVQVHSTDNANPYLKRRVQPDDGRLGVNPNHNDHNEPGGNVCASAYIGKLQDGTVAVYQALPWDYRCWLSGSGKNGNANKLGYIGFEVCEDGMKSREYFEDSVLDKAVLLTAYWCQEFGFNADEYVRDHSELHGMGLASNHGDISEWLKAFGYTMNDFRARVKEAMKDGVSVTYIDCDETGVLFRARAINPGTYLNIRSGKGTMYASVGKIPQGEICDVLDDTDSAWWKVHFRGVTGYAMSEYLERIPEDNDDGGVPGGEQDEGGGDATDGGTEDKDGYFIPRRLAVELFGVLGAQLGDEAKMSLDCRSETLINEDYR